MASKQYANAENYSGRTTEVELDRTAVREIEHMLKKSLAERMTWIQRDRAILQGGRNASNARKYVREARALREILKAQRGETTYQRVCDIHIDPRSFPDEVAEVAGFVDGDTARETCEKIHAVSNPHFSLPSLTENDKVPGRT